MRQPRLDALSGVRWVLASALAWTGAAALADEGRQAAIAAVVDGFRHHRAKGLAVVGRSHLVQQHERRGVRTLGALLREAYEGEVTFLAPTFGMTENVGRNRSSFSREQVVLVETVTRGSGVRVIPVAGDELAELDGAAVFGEDMSMDGAGRIRPNGRGTHLGESVDALLHLGLDGEMELERPRFSPEFESLLRARRELFVEAGRRGLGGFRVRE